VAIPRRILSTGIVIAHHVTIGKDEIVERMPLRDKKATGYRFEPSIQADRLRAVNLMFELYDAGLEFHEISRNLWHQGFKHYDKPFGYHGVETILDNPAYVGLPAWGKIGVGTYRILHDGGPAKIRRRASDTLTVHKDDSQYIQPLRPVFPPIVPVDLWQRVHDRLRDRAYTNPDYGKRRTRKKADHPLNGKLFCPDCDEPMVLGSSMPSIGGRGKKTRCFNCGTYRRFSRLRCHANTVGWDRLDAAIAELFKTVKGRIGRFVADRVKSLRDESWARNCDLTKLMCSICEGLKEGTQEELADCLKPPDPNVPIFEIVVQTYNRVHARRTEELRQELDGIDAELARIGSLLLEGIPSQTVKKQLFDQMAKLEGRKKEIEPLLVPLTARAETLIEELDAVKRTIETSERAATAPLLDSFVEKVIPHFDVQTVGPSGKRRAGLRSVEFIPRKTAVARNVLPQAMEIGAVRTGNALFHLVASLFSLEVRAAIPCRKDTPVDEIRQLRALGRSVAEIARKTGATVAMVRRIVGKLDPQEKERRRKEKEQAAAPINAGTAPWADKVRRWRAETGQSEATLFRIIKRIKGHRPQERPGT
jgi:hypothetical protein